MFVFNTSILSNSAWLTSSLVLVKAIYPGKRDFLNFFLFFLNHQKGHPKQVVKNLKIPLVNEKSKGSKFHLYWWLFFLGQFFFLFYGLTKNTFVKKNRKKSSESKKKSKTFLLTFFLKNKTEKSC